MRTRVCIVGLCPVDQHLFLLDAETSECGVCVCETGEQGVVILGEDGSAAARTPQHSADAREAVWETTRQVLARSNLSLD